MDNPFAPLDDSGDPYALGAPSLYTASDIPEAAKMAPFVARVQGQEQAPWWQSIAQYGIVKAIDNTLPGKAPGMAGNVYPGSFAGQNGASYTQRGPLNQAPGLSAAGAIAPGQIMAGLPNWLLIGAAVALYIALKK